MTKRISELESIYFNPPPKRWYDFLIPKWMRQVHSLELENASNIENEDVLLISDVSKSQSCKITLEELKKFINT